MNHLDKERCVLFCDGKRLDPASIEKNMVGFCSLCQAEMESIAYHICEQNWLVSARCEREHLVLMRYDMDWNWLGDEDLEISAETEEGEIMGVRHRIFAIEGIQFHPESIVTQAGKTLLKNFLEMEENGHAEEIHH